MMLSSLFFKKGEKKKRGIQCKSYCLILINHLISIVNQSLIGEEFMNKHFKCSDLVACDR